MEVSIIVIGDELLIGQVVDTNSGDIARMIAPAGWTVKYVRTVHDDAEAIRSAICEAMEQTDIVLTTGGLGPTKDDITKATLCGIFGGRLVLDSDVLGHVRRVFERRGLNMNALTETQAMVPDSCTVLHNELGTAPVWWCRCPECPSRPGLRLAMRCFRGCWSVLASVAWLNTALLWLRI